MLTADYSPDQRAATRYPAFEHAESSVADAPRTQDSLAVRVAAAEAAERLAEEASRAKSELLAMMGHELRTPLNAISGYVQLLSLGVYGPVTPAQQDALMRADRAQRHLLRLVSDVMDLVRIERGQLEYDIVPVRVSDLTTDLETMIGPQARAQSLSFSMAECSDCVVLADRERLIQILLNLLSNAVKFTPEGGRVHLDCPTRADGSGGSRLAYIRVSDTGPGIPLPKQAAVFEPFVQVDASAKARASGAGLGLAISRDLAHGMHGELRVRSKVGVGSMFTLALPAAAGRIAAD